ncbi:6-hydroxymethylpterin diphosphokinase MptE-like protein [Paenibacillus sp. S150]|uniref:motility associated factor glycosyltransferase family protein n=1 Tax=Paenibacillus sp. S150 TaxID=2749826 RepID=UPI0028162FEE|nr:6-hydroxymethylpterin diphosphokinase MptE-like protein [Paenibacillus sp. S150]
MSYFEQNQTVLKKRFPHVANKMLNMETTSDDKTLYSEPLEKDHLWLEAVEGSVEERKLIFLYGFGQGLGLVDLLEMYPDRMFFVYEPNEENFRKSLEQIDLGLILEQPNLFFLSVGKSQLNPLFYSVCTHIRRELAFVALRNYLENSADVLLEVKNDFRKYSENFDANRLTQHRFRNDWLRNSMLQLAGMLTTPNIKELYKAYENTTAIIIASGPSLQTDIEWVRKMKPHALIICAGSSIQAMVKNGIQPHLTALLDGNPINNRVFSDPSALAAPFLFLSSSYYEIGDKKKQDKIHAIIHNDEVSQYYLGISKQQAQIRPTSTVAGTAVQAAIWLGAKRVVLMGQDLSFPDEKYYADGVGHFEKGFTDSQVKNSTLTVLNVQGTYNSTNASFLAMKESLESLFGSYPDVEFINSTRKGAVIEGTVWKPAEEVFEMLSKQSIGENAIRDLINKNDYAPTDKELLDVRNKVSASLRDLDLIMQEFKKIRQHIGKLRELSRANPNKCQRTIVEIEKMWGEVIKRPWFEVVFETLMPLEIAEYDRGLPAIVSEKNLVQKSNLINDVLGTLLKEVEKEVPFLEEVFEEALRRLELISA